MTVEFTRNDSQSESSSVAPPDHYVCPLTQEIMTHPVMTKYGHNFEKTALTQWLNRGNDTCPLTRQPLHLQDIISNRSLEQQIVGWRKLHGMMPCALFDEQDNDNICFSSMASGYEQTVLMARGEIMSQRMEDKMVQQAQLLIWKQLMEQEMMSGRNKRSGKKGLLSKLLRRR